MKIIAASELIVNPDGSVFHLHLRPEHFAPNIILVGDPDRVDSISNHFDTINFKIRNREFVTHSGTLNNQPIMAVSTGIGTDNIDIVLNELDAVANIDLNTRTIKENHTSLNIVRLGTSGGLQEDLGVDGFVASQMAIGLDGVLNFYSGRNEVSNLDLERQFLQHTHWNQLLATPYCVESSSELLQKLAFDIRKGITITANGFYAPQGRELRIPLANPDLNDLFTNFKYKDLQITNFEMECSAIYGLSRLLGHNALTICVIIANRVAKMYSKDYKKPVENLIVQTLERLTK